MNSHLRVYFFLSLGMVFWGLSFIWYKSAYAAFEPVPIIFFRLVISSPLIFLFAKLLRRWQLPARSDLKYFLLLALFEPLLYFLGETYGVRLVSSTLASIIIATIPLFTPFVAFYFLRERLSSNNYLGILISFAGVILVVYAEEQMGDFSVPGVLLMLLAVVSALAYAVLLRKVSGKYNALSIVGIQNLLGILYFAPLFFALDYQEFCSRERVLSDWLPVLYLAVFGSAAAFILFVQGVKALGVAKATVFTNFIPVITAVFSILLGLETANWQRGLGIFITIFGLFMSQAGGIPGIRIFGRVQR